MINVEGKVVLEDENEDDWGFDEPTCFIDTNMQANVDKAMVRITAKLKELDSKEKEVPKQTLGNFSTPKHDGCVILFDDMDASSRFWEALQIFREPLQMIGNFLESMFEWTREYQGQHNIVLSCKLQINGLVLWETNIKVWDPGKGAWV